MHREPYERRVVGLNVRELAGMQAKDWFGLPLGGSGRMKHPPPHEPSPIEQLLSSISASPLEWIAAGGSLVSVTTLLLTLYFRRRDRRTHLNIKHDIVRDHVSERYLTYVRDMPDVQRPNHPALPFNHPAIFFRLTNTGSIPITVTDIRLRLPDGQMINLPDPYNLRFPTYLEPWRTTVFAHSMKTLAEVLLEMGYKGKSTLTLVVRDDTGKRRKRKFTIPDLQAWAKVRHAHAVTTEGEPIPDETDEAYLEGRSLWLRLFRRG
jgi:hypothetical protein